MKKFLLSVLTASLALPALADLGSDGYYRVQNAITKRYAYLTDNRGYFDVATSSADVAALQLYSGFTRASSDPASVFYIKHYPNSGSKYNYDIGNQGTSIKTFLDEYLKIMPGKTVDGIQAYYAYATKSGITKYLGDIRSDDSNPVGYPSADAQGDRRLWYIDPVKASDANAFFGVAPTVTAGGKYYYPLYAAFPFDAYSPGVKFYTISKVDAGLGVAVLHELQGVVPGSTPVIVECSHPLAADNRLNVGPSGSQASVGTSLLKGVYFDNSMETHYNRTPYNAKTMRVLSAEGGKLAFTTASLDFLPANQAYLSLTSAEEQNVGSFTCMTEADYNAYVASVKDLNPDGYYRMQNAGTSRYALVNGAKGSLGASPNVSAFQLCSDFLREAADPASVFLMTKSSLSSGLTARNLSTQGTSTDKIFGTALNLTPAGESAGMQTFTVSGNAGSGVRTLGDAKSAVGEWGSASVSANEANAQWWFKPISADNYLGVKPEVEAGGKYFATFMAGFPVAAASNGMKFFTVTCVDAELGVMVKKEVSGVIPAGTPVLVECVGPLASSNVLSVGASGQAADVAGNLLKGVWFDSDSDRTPFDAKSMRLLSASGQALSFATASNSYVPRNQAYISLSSEEEKGVQAYDIVTEEEYARLVEMRDGSPAAGWYRIRNNSTGRNLYVLNNAAAPAPLADGASISSLQLVSDYVRTLSDPACVVNVKSASAATGSSLDHDILAQGTSFRNIFSSYVKTLPVDADGTLAYQMWISVNGISSYLCDSDQTAAVSVTNRDGKKLLWDFNPVDVDSSDNYFGVAPTVTAGGKYYAPFYASFPFQPVSDDVKVYGVDKVDTAKEIIVIKEYTGVIPASTPVIILCAGPLPSDNRLAVGEGSRAAEVKGNRLLGVWYDFDEDGVVNQTPFDTQSMRVIGEKDGKLVFTKADYTSVPRNEAYIKFEGPKPMSIDTYQVMTEAEYADNAVEGIEFDPNAPVEYYNTLGQRLDAPAGGIVVRRQGAKADKVMAK